MAKTTNWDPIDVNPNANLVGGHTDEAWIECHPVVNRTYSQILVRYTSIVSLMNLIEAIIDREGRFVFSVTITKKGMDKGEVAPASKGDYSATWHGENQALLILGDTAPKRLLNRVE